MKKLFLIIASLMLIFALGACSSQNEVSLNNNMESLDTSQNESENNEAGKILIVYFSATGNTEKAAESIASAPGGETFELVPVQPYSGNDLNWNDETSRVVYEYNHPNERKIALESTAIDNFAEYDTVFIGYPIWWGIAAWPIDSFIEANDFTGKTVIPFCTSSSSGLGESGELLKESAGTGSWLEGIRFSSSVLESEVLEGLKSLGF